jgi:polyferredoxin
METETTEEKKDEESEDKAKVVETEEKKDETQKGQLNVMLALQNYYFSLLYYRFLYFFFPRHILFFPLDTYIIYNNFYVINISIG